MHKTFLSALALILIALNISVAVAQTASKVSDPYKNRGTSWFPGDDLERALKDSNIAVIFHPNSATAFYNRGLLLQARGELERALADYNKAIDIKPRYASAYNNRAGVHYALGHVDEALEEVHPREHGERSERVGVVTPCVVGAVPVAPRRRDQEQQAAGPKDTGDLDERGPREGDVLEDLVRHHDVDAVGLERDPVRLAHHDVDVGPWDDVQADVRHVVSPT